MSVHIYGVFLRPDTQTAMAVSDVTFQVERQFGFVSAGAFPPHATLAGSVPSAASVEEIVATLDPVIASTPRIPVHNSGIVKHNIAIAYDVDHTADGAQNLAIKDLAVAVNHALEPIAESREGYLVKPFSPDTFRAHLSLASHELQVRPELSDEVESFIRALPYTPSSDFLADTVTLYRFHSDQWSAQWWRDLTWEPLHSWTLRA